MHLRSVLLILGIFCMGAASAQALKLSGKVVSEKNEALAGVSIKLNTGGGTTTNVDGAFTLTLNTGIKYALTISAIGYADKTISDVEVLNGQTNELNIVLQTSAKDLGNVVITARASNARRESTNSMIAFQKNT